MLWSQIATRPTRRDLLFAALVALLLTISPVTGSARLWLSALLGVAGGCVVLAVRIRRRRSEPAVSLESAARVSPRLRAAPLPVAALAAVGLAFAPTLVWLYGQHTDTQWRNVHGVFVPLFVFLLARSALRRDPTPEIVESSPWGLPLVIAGLGLAVIDAGVRSHYFAAIGALLCLPGLSLLFLGARRTRILAAPLALCWFVLPVPEALADPIGINAWTCAFADRILHAVGVVVLRHDTLFMTRNGPFNVSQNCSGLAALYAGAALAFVLAKGARDRLHRVVVPLLVYPLTLVSNGVRVVALTAITERIGTAFLLTPLHGLSGLLVLWFVLGCLWLCADRAGVRESLA